jgi:molybdopterin-guanine dinucleotide biosynthesis protein A
MPPARPEPGTVSAVLLAAGRSTRMGHDKALLRASSGEWLWQRQRHVLAQIGAGEIFLSARPDQAWVPPAAGFAGVVFDATPDGGPLDGIVAALERASGAWLAVLAIDLPRLPAAWFGHLAKICAPGIGAVGRSPGGFEPLAAFYPREILPSARAASAAGERSLQRFLAGALAQGLMRAREITPDESAWFENWNEPRATAQPI